MTNFWSKIWISTYFFSIFYSKSSVILDSKNQIHNLVSFFFKVEFLKSQIFSQILIFLFLLWTFFIHWWKCNWRQNRSIIDGNTLIRILFINTADPIFVERIVEHSGSSSTFATTFTWTFGHCAFPFVIQRTISGLSFGYEKASTTRYRCWFCIGEEIRDLSINILNDILKKKNFSFNFATWSYFPNFLISKKCLENLLIWNQLKRKGSKKCQFIDTKILFFIFSITDFKLKGFWRIDQKNSKMEHKITFLWVFSYTMLIHHA